MAKSNRHIDLELKVKLGTHEVPVTESDWTAFESYRNKKETGRRRFIYLIAAALVFIGVSGMLVWKLQETKRNGQTETPDLVQSPTAPEQGTETPYKIESIPSQRDQKVAEESSPEQTNKGEDQSNPEPDQTPTKLNPESPSSVDGIQDPSSKQDGIDGAKTPVSAESDPQRYHTTPPDRLPSFALQIPAPLWSWADIPYVTAYEGSKDKDSSKTLPGMKGKKFLPLSTPSLAFGLAYGFGNPSLTIGDNDTNQTHRQYESTLKDAKQSSKVFRLFLQYEYRLKFGFEVGAGLQFSSQTQVRQYNFEMRDVPYLKPNGDIWFYIPIPASQPVTPTVFESRQQMFSASVPVSIGYAHTLGTNFRLGLRAQGSLGINWSKGFTGLSPKTLSATTLSANANPLNMRYGGGLFGEYFYLERWSARLSLDWTAQNKLYKNSNSYNITNRYYEFKLALVRYL